MDRQKPLHIWIIGDHCRGISLSLSTRRLKLLAFSIFLLPLLIGGLGVEIGRRVLAPKYLREHQVLANAPIGDIPAPLADANEPVLQAAEEAVAAKLPDADSPLEERQIFTDELAKLRKYESELQKRANMLDAVISQASRLEFDPGGSSLSPNSNARSSLFERQRKSRVSIGGGDEPRSPLFRVRPLKKTETPTDEKISFRMQDLDEHIRRLNAVPIGTPAQGRFSSGFGYRYDSHLDRAQLHSGLDISADVMTPAVATADGLVINAGPKGNYGNCIIIQHARGVETLYAHLARVSVKPGDKVHRGQLIGLTGNSGRSTGPHIHYEVRIDGVPRDPMPFLELAKLFRTL